MSISAKIIKDSVGPYGQRITTFVLEYPRFIHAELLTHRVFSKNSASSRAIPIEKLIQQVIDNPAMPVWWGKNQPGMQANEELSDNPDILTEDGKISEKELAKRIWLEARDSAIEQVRTLSALGLHKQIANRILEPWFNIKVILTATEFDNFFELRCHKDAQPEIQQLARKMQEAYNDSVPDFIGFGGWHIPFGDQLDDARVIETDAWKKECGSLEPETIAYNEALVDFKIRIAVARCARVSYLNFEGKDDYEADLALCARLFGANPKHLSPTEHVAYASRDTGFHKNFRGWVQYRQVLEEKEKNDNERADFERNDLDKSPEECQNAS